MEVGWSLCYQPGLSLISVLSSCFTVFSSTIEFSAFLSCQGLLKFCVVAIHLITSRKLEIGTGNWASSCLPIYTWTPSHGLRRTQFLHVCTHIHMLWYQQDVLWLQWIIAVPTVAQKSFPLQFRLCFSQMRIFSLSEGNTCFISSTFLQRCHQRRRRAGILFFCSL